MSIFDFFRRKKSINNDIVLSEEQQIFLNKALSGKNILVDACIGSGKTTAIQHLCDIIPISKHILYLTYNRLLKIDAQKRIKNSNVTVTNYHGFAAMLLKKANISSGVQDMIQDVLYYDLDIPQYDILIIDEYQDIEQEFADMLEKIKLFNPYMQIIAVGDMQQKIYDKTALDVRNFITSFLDDYIELTFTKCFRLSSKHAAMLGRVWGKQITGVNRNCDICEMSFDEVVEYLSDKDLGDILCLGSGYNGRSELLNKLEEVNPLKFNKKTVYSSISDYDDLSNNTKELNNVAVFTTYDRSKGIERKICVLFDFTENYWGLRSKQPLQNYEILRNIFCVAASRGKEKIIIVKSNEPILSEKMLSTRFDTNFKLVKMSISEMFDFKYIEDVENCYNCLNITEVSNGNDCLPISVKVNDYLIDLSPCIGIFQEAFYFRNYNIDKVIRLCIELHRNRPFIPFDGNNATIEKKVLYLTYLETNQKRYYTQTSESFIEDDAKKQLHDRLDTVFCETENAQKECCIDFGDEKGNYIFSAFGLADVVKDSDVYELKFVSELMHKHYLQCACYMIALDIKTGYLWNTRTNKMFRIEIEDKEHFLDCVVRTITKGVIKKYYKPKVELGKIILRSILNIRQNSERAPMRTRATILEPDGMLDKEAGLNYSRELAENNKIQEFLPKEKIAVIDIETTFEDKMMSVGIALIDKESFTFIGDKYYIIDPEFKNESFFSGSLFHKDSGKYRKLDRQNLREELPKLLEKNNVKAIFAYNASFDYKYLDELWSYPWYDIMKIAAYKQHNKSIPKDCSLYSSGKMKKGYKVEDMYRLLSGDNDYTESHNAMLDALGEAKIVQMLDQPFSYYFYYARYK